ncbi:MAG: hypothetical protein ACM35G_02780 [Planctomycetaceae bacterium]
MAPKLMSGAGWGITGGGGIGAGAGGKPARLGAPACSVPFGPGPGLGLSVSAREGAGAGRAGGAWGLSVFATDGIFSPRACDFPLFTIRTVTRIRNDRRAAIPKRASRLSRAADAGPRGAKKDRARALASDSVSVST